jgi:hypothetical protein
MSALPYSQLSTRELVARYNATATWDYRKDQYANALDARGYDWDGHESVDSRDFAHDDGCAL